jgi:hypothetical protein
MTTENMRPREPQVLIGTTWLNCAKCGGAIGALVTIGKDPLEQVGESDTDTQGALLVRNILDSTHTIPFCETCSNELNGFGHKI